MAKRGGSYKFEKRQKELKKQKKKQHKLERKHQRVTGPGGKEPDERDGDDGAVGDET